jgi:hypothetical protein
LPIAALFFKVACLKITKLGGIVFFSLLAITIGGVTLLLLVEKLARLALLFLNGNRDEIVAILLKE